MVLPGLWLRGGPTWRANRRGIYRPSDSAIRALPPHSIASPGPSILTAGLLGEQYVGLEGGADDAVLANGDTIKLTQSAVVLEKLISQFMYSKAAEGGSASK